MNERQTESKTPSPFLAQMHELFDAVTNPEDRPFSRDDLIAAMQDCDVLVPCVTDKIDGEMIAHLRAAMPDYERWSLRHRVRRQIKALRRNPGQRVAWKFRSRPGPPGAPR